MKFPKKKFVQCFPWQSAFSFSISLTAIKTFVTSFRFPNIDTPVIKYYQKLHIFLRVQCDSIGQKQTLKLQTVVEVYRLPKISCLLGV